MRTGTHLLGRASGDVVAPAVLGFTGLGCAAVFFVVLHALAPASLNPLREPMSDYALADGVGWMFPVGVGFIAIGGAGATLGLARSGLLGTGWLRWAMTVIVTSAIGTAVFPTDEDFPLSLTAEIHRYAAITLFVAVPVAAMLAATAHGHDAWLLATGLVATGLLVVFLLSHLAVMPQALQDLRGLFQRVLVVVDLAILGRFCRAAHRATMSNTASGTSDTASRTQDTTPRASDTASGTSDTTPRASDTASRTSDTMRGECTGSVLPGVPG
ncbi:DUF998 domain-containing protein [Haloechinothrix halophila]|uniref:DUF998 domain-containing protein n=1 Tax=Haloechinothrix halophila TaxID=1069073 RepID=UPI00041F8121|nr:DUF998 domain-containing protein [Haloechinothrix halophila]